ncbi:MAG: DUF2007 domain-containing protein [Actinobacteria bacterium]|nr:DUF2007 domain-containing protein [Actinomycetota bacterium]
MTPRSPHLPGERDDISEVGGHCPACGAEYRPGFDTCADDGTELVAGPAPKSGPWSEPVPPDPRPRIHTAVLCALPFEEAYMLVGRLGSEGVEAAVDPPDYASYYGKILHRTFNVIVPESQIDEARAILDSVGRGE